MKKVLIIASREFKVRARAKATIISTLVVMLVLLCAGGAVRIFNPFNPPEEVIGLTPQTQDYAPGLMQSQSLSERPSQLPVASYEVLQFPDDAALEQAVKDEKVSAGIGGELDRPVLMTKGSPPMDIHMLVAATYSTVRISQYLSKLGGSLQEATSQIDLNNLVVKDVSQQESEVNEGFNLQSYITVLLMLAILFAFITTAGQIVASGVVEEKISRVVEVLISTVSARQLLLGKILGIGMLQIVQVLLVGGAGISALLISGTQVSAQLNLGVIGAWLFVWFVLGFATYVFLYAGAGALVSRQEEVSQSALPLILLSLGGFYVAIFASLKPNLLAWKIISMLPFLNCFMMPSRQVTSSLVEWWEPWLSLGINLAVLPVLIQIGSRLYYRGLLATSGRIKIGDAWRSVRAKTLE